MKILISPAKSLGQQQLQSSITPTHGAFIQEAESLAKKLKKFSVKKIEKMMHVSNDIATLNYHRFQDWVRPENKSEAILPALAQFTGEVYRGLDAETLSAEQLEFAQKNLRILSGMYGILKPMDLMFPYRLEMGTSWAITPKTKSLYQFWGKKLSVFLNNEMEKGEVVVNLASTEYFKAIDKKTLKAKIITPHFKELKNDKYTVVAIFAKNARGKMTRYAIENKISDVEELKNFDVDGYRFHESLSSETDWVFTR
jgi:cytoplasmic iron level regulating protein YaaA (DUF328/UPF0246 family)